MILWKFRYGEERLKDGLAPEIFGPIYVKENTKHLYQEQPKPDHLKTVKLQGPIYINDDTRHHFSAIEDHLETLKTLKGPVYDVERKNRYMAIIQHVESLKDLQGPIYKYGETAHKFEGGQVLLPAATELKSLHGPRYDIDNQHQFSEIIKQASHLKDLAGPVYEVGETAHHFREFEKNVESLKTLMGPIYVEEGVHR